VCSGLRLHQNFANVHPKPGLGLLVQLGPIYNLGSLTPMRVDDPLEAQGRLVFVDWVVGLLEDLDQYEWKV
jgi:hypothetical protein